MTTNTAPGLGIHVLVPLLVVDELDRLKRDNRGRSRARTALKTLNQVFANVSADRPMGRLRHAYSTTQPDATWGWGRSRWSCCLTRQTRSGCPDNDAEIVDRALAVQAIAGQPVTMVTYDTSMSFRARQVGLKDLLLTLP